MMLLRGGMNVSNLAQEDREKEKKKRKMMLIVLTFVLKWHLMIRMET